MMTPPAELLFWIRNMRLPLDPVKVSDGRAAVAALRGIFALHASAGNPLRAVWAEMKENDDSTWSLAIAGRARATTCTAAISTATVRFTDGGLAASSTDPDMSFTFTDEDKIVLPGFIEAHGHFTGVQLPAGQ